MRTSGKHAQKLYIDSNLRLWIKLETLELRDGKSTVLPTNCINIFLSMGTTVRFGIL